MRGGLEEVFGVSRSALCGFSVTLTCMLLFKGIRHSEFLGGFHLGLGFYSGGLEDARGIFLFFSLIVT